MTATITHPQHVAAGRAQPFDGDAYTRVQAEHGNTPAARRARPELYDTASYTGTLWERASDLDTHPTNKRGTVMCYRVTEKGHTDPTQHATREAAERAAGRYSEPHRVMFRIRVVAAPYFTKSGRLVKSAMPSA